jgi:cytochrome d ubiquinol oxidase subunit II
MATLWFWLVAVMIAAYVVLDGFDLGAGALHLHLGRSDGERNTLLRTIGPVWDGNEVWLLAGGGTLYFAFPALYASAFSGFYLPLMIVLWLLMLRAVGLEFRAHLASPVWRAFCDGCFSLSSGLLMVFYGAALGNVIRGVPLGEDGYFFLPLWTNWRTGAQPGILDWYTVLCGVVAVAALTLHGALWIAYKTTGELQARARRSAALLWPALVAATLVSLPATIYVRPDALRNYEEQPLGFLIPVGVALGLAGILWNLRHGQDGGAFLASCGYLVFMLVGAVFALYPYVLPSSGDPSLALTVDNASAAPHGLSIGIVWWSIGMAMALGYFVFTYRMFHGKVSAEGDGHY